jgi:U3 small nucleolar RNA-associated protein 10
MHDISLSTAVVLKPSKRATLTRLQVTILAMLSNIQRPASTFLNWLEPSKDNTPSAKYTDLMRRAYKLVNSSGGIPTLSSALTKTLFVSLGEDSLKFLAGIWLQFRSTQAVSEASQYSAVKHAAAFIEAHYSTQRFVDFQTVLPAVLVAVQLGDHRLREAALDCITGLNRLSQAKSPSGVYAFDAIYGASSGM